MKVSIFAVLVSVAGLAAQATADGQTAQLMSRSSINTANVNRPPSIAAIHRGPILTN